MEYRIGKDSIGEIKVPVDKLWGAQTQRSFENFRIGTEKIPLELVAVFGVLIMIFTFIWHLYRIVRGWIALTDGRPVP